LDSYQLARRLFRERLRWDLQPESWRSRKRLRELRDTHPGKSAVVLCNGPSLLKVDFARLAGTYTFGLNKINLLFEKSPFRPSCIVAVNPLVIEQNAGFYRSTTIPLFLDSGALPLVGPAAHVSYLHKVGVTVRRFSQDVSQSIWQGHTVTFVALQIAFHLGFRRVALVGCDHDFAAKGKPNQTVTAGAQDESHFDPRYFSGGMQWQLPDLRQSEIAYLLAAEAFEDAGGQVVNATEGGRLEVLPRMSLGDFLAGGGA
jgi:hypothetical protein